MFNLEQSIADWRRQMLADGINAPVPMDELENHLREEIEWQKKAGQGEAEAFAIAVRKIGPAPTVKIEFEKIGTTRNGLNWKRFEVLFLVYAALYPLLVGSLAFVFKNGSFSEMTTGQQYSCLASAIAFSLLAWGMQWGCGKFPNVRTNRVRDVIFIPVMFWLVTFAYLIMPHIGLAESQRAVVSLWGLVPFAIVLGWVWGFANAAQKEHVSAGA